MDRLTLIAVLSDFDETYEIRNADEQDGKNQIEEQIEE